jgi:glycosyltransferase involved in cell wall biosynthesis
MVLPMNLGVGFRGRAVEVMSLGVPVIGNHNALDCIGITNCVNGFISDDYGEIAGYALKLSNDSEYRLRVSKNTLDFIRNNFSIGSTYGKLSEIFNKM